MSLRHGSKELRLEPKLLKIGFTLQSYMNIYFSSNTIKASLKKNQLMIKICLGGGWSRRGAWSRRGGWSRSRGGGCFRGTKIDDLGIVFWNKR